MSSPRLPELTSTSLVSLGNGDRTIDGEMTLASFEQSFHPDFEDEPSPSSTRIRPRVFGNARPLSLLSNVSELSEVDLDSTPTERLKRSQLAAKRRLSMMASEGHLYNQVDEDAVDRAEEFSKEITSLSHPNSRSISPEISENSRRNSFRTPMNVRAASEYPTNTAIANRVQAIQLPQTAMKEYSQWRDNNLPPEGGKAAKLSLKEQIAMVDKLKKDNFGLQLKVFYLSQLLEKRSDESVNEMQQENVDLKIAMMEMKRALKEYKSRIDELERRQCEKRHVEEDQEFANLNDKVQEYKSTIDHLQQQLEDRLVQPRHGDSKEMTHLRDLFSRERAEKERLQSQLSENNLFQENESLRSELSQANSLLEARTREKSSLYTELEALKLNLRRDNGNEIDHQECELALDELRDKISEVKLASQDRIHEVEHAYEAIRQEEHRLTGEAARTLSELAEELDLLREDKREMERYITKLEESYELLKGEAEYEVDRLDDELDVKDRVLLELKDELEKVVSDNISLEEGLQTKNMRISDLRKRLEDAAESETIFKNQLDGLNDQKADISERLARLSVQHESSEREIRFLKDRERELSQNIGVKEEAIRSLEQHIQDQEEKWKLLTEEEMTEQRPEDFDVKFQKMIEHKNEELETTRSELWTLRRNFSVMETKETESQREIIAIDNAIRDVLQDESSNRHELFRKLRSLRRDLDTTTCDLENLQHNFADKEKGLKKTEQALEAMATETKRLADRLDRERQSRKQTQSQLQLVEQSIITERKSRAESSLRLADLEKARSKENKALTILENQYREQVQERNNLLSQIFERLRDTVGYENLRDANVLPSMNLKLFSSNMLTAVKCVEFAIRTFQTKCKDIERDLVREYQNLENAIESRTKRIQRLESLARNGLGESHDLARQITSLKMENRNLKSEYHIHLQKCNGATQGSRIISPGSVDRRWHLRLKELEGRLKASEEARARDRRGAKDRLEESQKVIGDLQRPNTTSTELSEGSREISGKGRELSGKGRELSEGGREFSEGSRERSEGSRESIGKSRTIIPASSFPQSRIPSRDGIFSRGKSSTGSPADEAKEFDSLL
ncbi:Anucleate primary sterigmata protein B isoform B [Neolecta irregularis DAH-3]|uniref:Anucleate primary sterigmata protein B isoform A n=1 Tax=Neolecta irregularis (strain DAH-3) TaxID=1198029 RepID=A0A1U7LTU6_NEOID|nr:Anucleate primary sterigmata protein B isoform A [Neolecta irregularis DAH-3]OLL26038.1 Anucleate primary sterigmata protein B isoform B [Neolecta irregularis DAH-3]|eukprot:OLL26037.1 Anucleate primary sterigmata protein B isoform A [Neolecta irregularis DAH-3]